MTKECVVYVGKDNDFYKSLKAPFLEDNIHLSHFFEDNFSLALLTKSNCKALIMESNYKSTLAIIEAIRTSFAEENRPYILVVGDINELKSLKNQFTTRNYPDDICVKNIKPECIVNQTKFILTTSEEIGRERTFANKDVVRGDLKTKSYGSIIYDLYESGFTGKLILESLSDKAVISFADGQPINVKFNKIQFTLGRILLKKGLLNEEDYLKSLDLMLKEGKRHGDIIISMNLLKPSDIAEAIREQFYEKLSYFFSKEQADFLIVRSELEDINFSYPRINIFSLIYYGIKRYAPTSVLMEKYLGFKEKYIAITEKYTLLRDKIPFDGLESEILNYFEDPKRVTDILGKYAKDFNTVFKIIEITNSFQMIRFADDIDSAKNISLWANPKMIEIKENIIKDYINFKEKNYYEILGIPFDAKEEEIKKRYIELVKKYHPDRYSHIFLTKDLLQKINETFQIIQTAYEVLSDKSKRESYDATIQSPLLKEMMEKTENIMNAEIAFKKGEILLKRRDYKGAQSFFKEAVKLNNKEPEYLVNLAITNIFLKEMAQDGYSKEARSCLERAIYLNPYCEKAYYYLGILNKLEDKKEEAILCFKKTININPDNKEAYLELKSLEKI